MLSLFQIQSQNKGIKGHHEKDISTKQHQKSTDSRLQGQDAHSGGHKGPKETKSQGTKTVGRLIPLFNALKKVLF
jgi:hypothetical protein